MEIILTHIMCISVRLKKNLKRAIKEKKYLCGEIVMNELITL